MAKIRVFDFLLTAAALTALFLLLPPDKETKLAGKELKNSQQVAPVTSRSPKTKHQETIKVGFLRQA